MHVPHHSRRVYIDVCALSRPFDDLRQLRLLVESNAVLLILAHIKQDEIEAVWSEAHRIEMDANRDSDKRSYLLGLMSQYGTQVNASSASIWKRVDVLRAEGLGVADAVHVAIAESVEADFVTCDDRLIRQLRRVEARVWFGTPPEYCVKEDLR